MDVFIVLLGIYEQLDLSHLRHTYQLKNKKNKTHTNNKHVHMHFQNYFGRDFNVVLLFVLFLFCFVCLFFVSL